jgi:nucleoside-diphosphate-sugar epimerase
LTDLQVEQVAGDLRDPGTLAKAVHGVDRVFHCAALVADWGDFSTFQAVNVDGTYHLLDAALDNGIRKFVHISSTEVYGHPDYPADEEAPLRYRGWPYCDTKIDAEKHAWAFARRGLPITIIRPATVYGPRWSALIEFVKVLKQGQMILVSGGRKNAGLIYVENLCDLLLVVGEPHVGVGRVYNASDGLDVTWAQFLNSLAAMLDQEPVRRSLPRGLAYAIGALLETWGRLRRTSSRPLVTRMAVEMTGTDQGFPNDRAREELGWEPRVDISVGMRHVRAWLSEEGCLNQDNVASAA